MQRNLFGEEVGIDHNAEAADFWMTPARLYPKNCFDPCPINPKFNGLEITWHGDAFVNPPYSQIPAWISKALRERANCTSIVMLLPNWTDRGWFQAVKRCPIEFLQGRVRFLDPKTHQPSKEKPPFGSMLVHIKGGAPQDFRSLGGKARAKKLTKKRRSEIARMGGKARQRAPKS